MSENHVVPITYDNPENGEANTDNRQVGTYFTLSPMTDDFETIILDAINKVDLSNVRSETTPISTLYIGSEAAVFDALKACFLHAYRNDVHLSLGATISKGYTPENGQEENINLNPRNPRINAEQTKDIDFPVLGKFAIYPLSSLDDEPVMEEAIDEGFKRGLITGIGYYVANINGSVQDVFDYLEYVSQTMGAVIERFIIQVTLQCNVPELK